MYKFFAQTAIIGVYLRGVKSFKKHIKYIMNWFNTVILSNLNESTSTITKHPYSPDFVPPGAYSLSFRLDSFADGQTSATLSNIQVGLAH